MRYTISREGNEYWCHMEGYPYIPVFGSVGTKKKAQKVMRERNELLKKKGEKNGR